MEDASLTALWWAVIASGIYHGINPGMGWPLGVSAALMERSQTSLYRALGLLGGGHLLAMTAILLPFTLMFTLVEYQRQIQTGAAILVIGMGTYLLINRRHPRMLARVKPHRLALWSFLAAMAHGAGLMLVPIYLGICNYAGLDAGHQAAFELMGSNTSVAFGVAAAHTLAMMASGGLIAVGVYHWLGLKFLQRGWFNLDLVWALSLILVGVLSLFTLH
ncbi:MAG: hypothetical protein AAF382_02990 [Pseudomonadota bacterium]